MTELYPIGTLCWAKMKGFPPWPGRVSNPPASLKKSTASKKGASIYCIYFFGSNNYAWIEESQIKPYEAFKEQFSKAAKTTLKEAIDAIEDYINNKGEDIFAITDPEAEFNKLKESTVANEQKDEKKKEKKENQTPKEPKKTKIPKDPLMKKRKEGHLSHSTAFKKARRENDDLLTNDSSLLNHSSIRKSSGPGLLQRPSANFMVSSQQLDLESVSQTLKDKNILPSKLKFGFLGLGIMGSGIVKNLLNSGHKVIVWNRTTDKMIRRKGKMERERKKERKLSES
ncbi:conserved hypothetical protein [Pediculus humanus corporis]|uniref:PWWP domain-containing protein n=1 Tax=Pediculus humanus subsp. corporis TaxID=121224 RepID=E0VKD9_PEDHC|nr:uncharacterized protein Phum_PHUM261800 [Pediculus humanus corporis]EEB13855.1 conserved hypothetical protein [Pediculus humanus corporis]